VLCIGNKTCAGFFWPADYLSSRAFLKEYALLQLHQVVAKHMGIVRTLIILVEHYSVALSVGHLYDSANIR